MVSEESPLALLVLIGDEQLLLQRHEVPDKEQLCKLVIELATGRTARRRAELKKRLHDGATPIPSSEVTSMSDEKFEEQMETVSKLAAQIEVVQPPNLQELDGLVEEEELDLFLETLAAEKKAASTD